MHRNAAKSRERGVSQGEGVERHRAKGTGPVRAAKLAKEATRLAECWLDVFEGVCFQGTMRRYHAPKDVRRGTGGKKGHVVGSLIVGPGAVVIGLSRSDGGSADDGKMVVQFRPRQLVEDFSTVPGADQIEWLRVLETGAGG